jgi:hypothetical protein
LATALASLRVFADLSPTRLLFSHYGPIPAVEQALDRSAQELTVWVEETSRAHQAGLDLDHAVAMVAERTAARYALLAADGDAELVAKYELVAGAASNVSGILHWLSKPTEPGQR